MKRNRRFASFWRIVLLCSLVLGLAGCGENGSQVQEPISAEQPTEAQPVTTEEAVSDTEPALPATEEIPPEEKSSITILIPEDPPSFNAIVGDTGYDSLVMNLVMLGLTGVDPEGSVYTELAEELPTIENGDVVVDEEAATMDVTWKLRQDVQWADGTPVTADDVVFTWEAIMNPDTGIWVRGSDYVDSVEKIDSQTVVFHYNSLYPGYLIQLGGEQLVIWPAHYCKAEEGFTAWECARQPLSNGPFILTDWMVGDHMTFERNPNYFEAGKPNIDEIIVSIVPDESVRKQMMLQGDGDLIMWLSEQMVADLSNQEEVKVSISPYSRWVMRLFPNQAAKGATDPVASPHPVFSDVRVRKAVRMAVDVDTISNKIFLGYSKPIWTEFYRKPYECNIPRPVYDPEASKALLEEAGWTDTDGDGIRECHGCTTANEGDLMQVAFYTYAEYGEPLELTHQYIAENLKAIGIDAQLTVFEGSVLWAEAESGGIELSGDFDLDLWDDGYSGIDPTDYLWELYASAAAEPGSGWNIVRWKNEEFDSLLGQAYTLDESVRKQIFCQMAEILDAELPVILMFSGINAEAHSVRLEGVQSNINDLVSWNAADWKIVE
jgi:peptide/nickel transport system substrate-binding protein